MEAKDYVDAIRKLGLTQAQIAEKTGILQSTISKIERGDVSDVMSRNYRALQSLHGELSTVSDPVVSPRPISLGVLLNPTSRTATWTKTETHSTTRWPPVDR